MIICVIINTLSTNGETIMTATATINFSFSGTISQEIEILDPKLSVEEIIKGLNTGDFFTTVTHNGITQVKHIVTAELKEVAIIKSQDIQDHSELFDFSSEY